MSILKNIVDKKNKGEIKAVTVKTYFSEVVGEEIEFKKLPLSEYLKMVEGIDSGSATTADIIPMMNEMIFNFATMFRDRDSVEAAMSVYTEAETPMDLPEFIFEGNMSELSEMMEVINSFYDGEVEKARDDIKN